ncbi:MAG: DEAD/DEAH box helicase [Brachybacterium sp.]|uniref:DEAD/DEAH box helicase n=1 Tax=Brachybacterium sp. TaxID=1891286 RepID=UPI002649DB0A|nr:DEAD/DEAH box helicase [Brachybacterium sp.]MDN5685606.1 DEAD/DEAH box helicase [Brachybacterium sp.]
MSSLQHPSHPLALAGSDDPSELRRVTDAWHRQGPNTAGLTAAARERADQHLAAGQVPLLAGIDGRFLLFEFPDGATVHTDQRFFVRGTDRCSCGERECRHQLAALRALGENRFRRSWRSTPVLASADAAGASGAKPVVTGLVLSWDPDSGRRGREAIVLRPSRRTVKGTWHRTLTWDAISDGIAWLPIVQQNVLRMLDRWRWPHRAGIRLEDHGAELWTLVDSARSAGFEIAADGDLHLADQEIGVDLDLERAPGGLVLRAAPSWDEGAAPTAWSLLGEPAHAILAEHADGVVLHRLTQDVDALALLGAGEVWIPDADLPEFSRTALPRLTARPAVHLLGTESDLAAPGPPAIRWELVELEDHDWLDLDGTVTVGDEQMSLAVLIQALRSGQRYLAAGGLYVDLDTEEMHRLRTLLETAAALPDEERIRISRHDLDTWEQLSALDGIDADGDRWRTLLRGIRPVDLSDEMLDEAVDAELRPYQLEGYRWLSARWDAGLGGVLADDMGLGKTLQLLAAVRRHRRTDRRPVLVAAPRSVLGTWAQQAAQFVPDLRIRVITSRLTADLEADEADLVVVSHQLLRLDSERYQEVSWAALILDEAQAAKNPSSLLHRALRAQHRDVTFVVTGTPVQNSLQDLWALIALAAPGLLPPLPEFTVSWRRPIERGSAPELLATLRRRIAPVLLRRTKDLVARDLPPKLETTRSLQLAPAHVTRYTTALNKERQRVLGLLDAPERNRVEILAALTRLRLLATDPGTLEAPSAKVRELIDRLEELTGAGHRALVFSQFTSHLRTIREILEHRGITTAYLDGSTPARETVLDDFRTGEQHAFLISLTAGGSGLTLVEADYVFLLDPWWNPAVEEQAIDRTHRIGQDSAVSVYRLVSAETIEEKVLALQESKRALISSVMDPDAGITTALDAAQIRELITA